MAFPRGGYELTRNREVIGRYPTLEDAQNAAEVTHCLAAACRAVVDYNWTDELNDYEEDENDSRAEHIFNHLVALDNWINSTSHTPESYLRNVGVKRG